MVEKAIASKLEVRITNVGDNLVFHAKDGEVLFNKDVDKFWREAGR